MELFLLLIQVPILVIIIKYVRKLNSTTLLVNSYYYILSFKVTAGLFLGVLYFNYYKQGDTIDFYHDLNMLNTIFYTDIKSYIDLIFFREVPSGFKNEIMSFRQQRAYTFIRILSPLYILTGSNYWMLSVYLSLFSFTGLWVLSNTLLKFYKLNPLAVLISFFVFPSVVLWSSGIIKESLIIGMMSIIISILLNKANSISRFSIASVLIIIIFSTLLLIIKFYYFAALVAVLLPYCLIKFYALKFGEEKFKKSYQMIVLLSLIVLSAFIATMSHSLLNLKVLSEVLFVNYSETLRNSEGLNVFIFEGINSTPESFIEHIPRALSYGLFGPFLWHCKKLISFVNGIENTIILVLFITFLLGNFIKGKILKIGIEEVSLCIYIAVLAVFMAFASPNWGTLVRYKIGYLPFFLLLILNNNVAITQLERKFNFLSLEETKL